MIQVKDFFRNAQTIILIVAILIGGWIYFFHDKVFPDKKFPRIEITHDIFSVCLDSEHRLVRAKVEVRNVGLIQVKLSENNHSIAQVFPPLAGHKFGDADRDVGPTGSRPGLIIWPESLKSPTNLTDVILQPNEIHEQYHDFIIMPTAKVIEVRSTFKDTSPNKGEKIVNWEGEAKTIYEVGDPTCPQ